MNLYRRNIFLASLAVLTALMIAGAAQSLRRKPHQLRATSLAEVTVDSHGVMTARLIPITILADGTFHDASIYKNEPQPMVLDQGIVYEVQKTGQPVGFLTVFGKAVKDKESWTALGKWQAVSPPSTRAAATPNPSHPADERPILHRPGDPASSAPSASPTSPNASPTATPASSPSDSGSSDRPVLHRPESAATPTPSPAGTPSAGAGAPPAPAQAETPAPDTDRPTLRRRAPQSAGDSSAANEIAPAKTTPPGKTAPPPAELSKTPGTQSLVAVSDAQSSDSRSFQFIWKPGEEAPIDAKLRRLALAQLAGPVSESSLTHVVIRSFDLDLSNDAVMVISAEAPPLALPAAKGSKSATSKKTPASPGDHPSPPKPEGPGTSGATRYVTLIARVDFEGTPHKLASSVTDASRLDVAPRLELVDAVDVDGDGFGELLFRQYGFDEKSFVIYQIGRFTVTKLFEGASQSIK